MKKILSVLFVFSILLSAEGPRNPKNSPLNKSSVQEWKYFDINNILCTINSAGPYADYLKTNSSGLYWPKGTSKTAVYTSGIWIVGKHQPTNALRTAIQSYSTEFQPGTIHGTFNTTTNNGVVADDPRDTAYRIYKINKGDNASNNLDYAEWPGKVGAPYIDINNNGRWDNGIDAPKLLGDQTLWCVYNDADSNNHRNVGTTMPMGVEVQTMYYGYTASGPLQNTMFIQWKIINKSDAQYDSTFVGLFSDFDLGDANDDIDGYDTTLQLAYVLNGDDNDAGSSGYGTKPPACGTIFLGGYPTISPYAYPIFLKAQDPYGDIPLGNPALPLNAFNYLRGLTKTTGVPNINPITNQPSRFAFTGDPTTNQGWTRLNHGILPGEIRSLLSLGPITLAPEDTQIIHAAFIIAQGNDRFESFIRLRENALFIQSMFASNYSSPKATVRQTVQGDSAILTLRLDGTEINADSIRVEIISETSDSSLGVFPLFDDGSNGDISSGDQIFAGIFGLPATPNPVRLNALVTDKLGVKTLWPQIAMHVPLSKLLITDGIVVSDDLNGDKIANPGESVRYGFKLQNQQRFSFENITITPLPNVKDVPIHLDSLSASSTYQTNYLVNKPGSFLSFTLPADYTEKYYTVYLKITDAALNEWVDSIVFPVVSHIKRTSTAHRLSGRGKFDFDINVVQRDSVKNHLYVLRGVDSGVYKIYFTLKDSTDNKSILPLLTIPGTNAENLSHLIPVTDGFKIIPKKIQYPAITDTYLPLESSRWFKKPLWIRTSYPILSTVHYADIPNVTLKFSKVSAFTDENSNGKFDINEPYTFDLTNADRVQKAFLYALPSRFIGFIDIPFAVYDMGTSPPRKLTVVVVRSTSNPTPSRWMFGNDIIYIMENSYNPNGVVYDSSKGGTNLLPKLRQLESAEPIPYYYNIQLYSTSEPLKDTGDLVITYSPGFSSRDAFIFNPTDYKIEDIVVPTSPNLSQNYPNPFNPSTTIRYSLPKPSHASIVIYNILGQRVRTLLNEVRNAGTYEIDWDGRDDNGTALASGVYIYRFAADGSQMTKKMLLLK